MMKRKLLGFGLALGFGVVSAGTASADTTLGTTTRPAGTQFGTCYANRVFTQVTSDPGTPYSVPGAGKITQWQTWAIYDTPGSDLALVVLKPVGDSFTVVGVDARTIPSPAPAVATFALTTPIPVSGGETLGLYASGGAPTAMCLWWNGATPATATVAGLTTVSGPATGQTLNRALADSPGGYELPVAATFVPNPTATAKKKCKKKKQKRSAEAAKKKCKKKKKKS